MRETQLCIKLAMAALLLLGCGKDADTSRSPRPADTGMDTLRLGVALQAPSVLVFIAEANGYFADQGLVVQVSTYPSGKRALWEGLLTGNEDVVTTADVPYVFAALEGHPVKVLAQIAETDFGPVIVARKDRGIRQPADLAGHTLGTQKASAVHFFLHMFHTNQNIEGDSFDLKYYKAEALPQALARGEIDAFSMREPYVSEARALLGDNLVVFTEPGLTWRAECLVAGEEFIQSKPEAILKLLAGLREAEEFNQEQPEAARALLAGRLGVAAEELEEVCEYLHTELSLPQSLILNLETISLWAMSDILELETEMPNYLDRLYPEGLSVIKPDGVSSYIEHELHDH